MSDAATTEPTKPSACANCGATLTGDWCSSCGQNLRGNERLATKAIVGHLIEVITDYESATVRTFCDLWRRPGEVCKDYVEGRRKRYMNPVAYYLLSATVTVLLSAGLQRIWPSTHWSDGEFGESAVTYFFMATLIPTAGLWRWLFRKSGRNFAEALVFALYTAGHYAWMELLLTIPLAILVPENDWALLLIFIPFPLYEIWAAKVFFGDTWLRATLKILVWLAIMFVVGVIIVGILDVTGIVPVDVDEDSQVQSIDSPSVGHVGRESEQLWAEALLKTWGDMPRDDEVVERFLEAIQKADNKSPILVAMGYSLLGSEGRWRAQFLEAIGDRRSANLADLKRHLEELNGGVRDRSIRCFAEALYSDPDYKPAWQFLALTAEGELKSYAVECWKTKDPDNAFPWYLDADSQIAADDLERALLLIEAGNQCRTMVRYPVMIPKSFSLMFPDTEEFRRVGVAGLPVVRASLRNAVWVHGLSTNNDVDRTGRTRKFARWCVKQAELAVERGDADAERRYLNAVRELARQLIAMEPPDTVQVMVAMGFVQMTMNPQFPSAAKALGGIDPEAHALRIEGSRLADEFRNWNELNGQRPLDEHLFASGQVDCATEEQDAIRRIRAGSRYLQLLDETLLTDLAK
jgi:hypothetical protein